jgi:hypothetical protein
MERKMNEYLESLREQAGLGGSAAQLANELLVLTDKRSTGELTDEEYQFLVTEIADIRAQQELANDEVACRYIVQMAQILAQVV